jgi:hypothetical protein
MKITKDVRYSFKKARSKIQDKFGRRKCNGGAEEANMVAVEGQRLRFRED